IQKSHVDHSSVPRRLLRWEKGHMGQFSMKILPDTGSRLDGNQHLGVLSLLGLMIRQRNSLAAAGGNDELRQVRERRMLLALLRGFSATPLASPLSIAMAVLLSVLPGLEWVQLLLLGLTTAAILLTFGWVIDRITAPRHLAHLVPPTRGHRDPAALVGLVTLVLSVFGLAVVIETTASLPLNRAVLVALPLAGMA